MFDPVKIAEALLSDDPEAVRHFATYLVAARWQSDYWPDEPGINSYSRDLYALALKNFLKWWDDGKVD